MRNQKDEKRAISPSNMSSSDPDIEFSSSRPVEQVLFQNHFRCPITQQRMSDPVIAADGNTYERAAITQWIATHGDRAFSPMTGEQLEHLDVIPNLLVRQMMLAYQDTKPQRKRELTEQDILLAIQLREEEFTTLLAKQGKPLETVTQENIQALQKLELQKAEIVWLRRKVTELEGAQKVSQDKTFNTLDTQIKTLENQLDVEQQNHAASLIQKTYHRHRLKKTYHHYLLSDMRQKRWLYQEKEFLLKAQKEMREKFAEEELGFEKNISTLASQRQWGEVAKQSQLPEVAKQQHLVTLEEAKKTLEKLELEKQQKHQKIIQITNRFEQATTVHKTHGEGWKKIAAEQQRAYTRLGAYLTRREEAFKLRDLPKGSLFQSVPSCLSSSLPPLLSVQTALKSNQSLSLAQMELQNQLTQACYNADIDKVTELIEKQAADPAIPDKDGQQPLTAAIWGLALKVIDYLETKVNYTEQDWQEIARGLQNTHQILIPATTRIKTYGDWVNHFNGKEAPWFYQYELVLRRNDDSVVLAKKYWVMNVASICRGGVLTKSSKIDNGKVKKMSNTFKLKELVKKWNIEQVKLLENMCETMAHRLLERGVKFDENYRLIASSPVPITQ